MQTFNTIDLDETLDLEEKFELRKKHTEIMRKLENRPD